ncbi:NADase-type glycan-binding domain-containing protein [Salsipaludibacter albus]|uniref:NADase-type glycan-binding domain-containing protein n=1 Tax=Salsipaludibacter albus TaxID=2849650 RepID=UPI001EE4D0FE|nr:hypothetical protein [Salsipaludibacter albus]MBY5164308.1 hypothetical protein [Salsipaludibacter albus]
MQPGDQFCGHCGHVVADDDGAPAGTEEDATRPDDPGDATFVDPDRPALFDRPVRTLTPETVRVDLDDEPTNTGVEAPTEVIATTGGVDLATCPSCEAVNAVERRRCARCGTALHDEVDDTGSDDWELAELPSDQSDPDPLPTPAAAGSPRRRSRGLGIAIVVVGALLGATLAAFVFGIGPFERTTGVGIDFRGSGYEGGAQPLSPQRARTSTVLPDADGRSFGAPSAVDGDLATAWVAADPDEARLELAFDRPVWITGLELANGDQLDEATFETVARVRTLDLDFGFGTLVRATLISGTGRQVVRPPEPILTDRVVLEVVEATDGTGVGLSEISFVGFPANDDDTQEWDART